MALKVANNAASKLAAALTAAGTSVSITPGDGTKFPALSAGDWFPLTLVKSDGTLEIVRCTARATNAFTVTRAQEGTAALAFSAGDRVELRLTKAAVEEIQQVASSAAQVASVANQAAEGALKGMRNKIINGEFRIDQYGYVLGAATVANQFVKDRWFVTGTAGVNVSQINNKRTMTIPAGQTVKQVIEGVNLQSGVHVLSWEGTAKGRVGAGAYGASGAVTANVTGGTNVTIEFNAGTVGEVQFESGTVATPFEQRLYPIESMLCQWYFQQYYDIIVCGMAVDTARRDIYASFTFPEMRAIPTVTFAPASSGLQLMNATGPTINRNIESNHLRIAIVTGGAVGTSYWQGRITRSAEITS